MRKDVSIVRVAVVALALAWTGSAAYSQESVCLYNAPGAWFAAKMRVCADTACTDWSDAYSVGFTRCASLKSYSGTADIKVELQAVAGKTISCDPTFKRNVDFKGTAVFHAWGSTLDPKCAQPTTGTGQACVYLEPGAGYAALMRICKKDASSCDDDSSCTAWSAAFAIGKTSCQSLETVTAGDVFDVCLRAVAGRTIKCLPQTNKAPGTTLNITYQASGTTLQPSCRVPE